MRTLVTLAALMASLPTSAWALPVYLSCQPISSPDYQRFRSAQQKDAFIQGVFALGQASYLLPPSKTWMVDIDANRVVDLEEQAEKSSIRGAEISEGMILGRDGYGDTFELNRVSGKLSFTKYSGTKSFVVEGITVPTSATWTFQCKASKQRVL